ncbi:uncharacterized protein Z518_06648 [Rhinocladiella mackenziei CBS 650.93]|uniref:Uncharacterized protein n=1 Tax=Rhinocladiella mackenziei CBS 650.93 TaxID=1442369 RepID=A0A0D2GY17_9EURO|nr:uncharacterized protein Z518_06648 [Rhinocladiella mackenziei CBS 650.93]KIX03098.1 hypothetical protein Z518_06648 [Rhinocladiella mackenziei CBS 650.93]
MPPKSKRSQSPESRFLFVNEDASTFTRITKDAELDRTKQSHVQRQNFARKRRLREQSISAPPTSSQSSVSPGPTIADPRTEVSSSQGGPSHGTDYFDIIQNIDLGDPPFQSTSPLSPSQDPLDPRFSALLSDPFSLTGPSPIIPTRPSDFFEISHPYRPGHSFDTPSLSHSGTSPPRGLTSIASPPILLRRVPSLLENNTRLLEQWAPPLIQHYNTKILPETFWKDTQKVPLGQIRHALSIHADMQACMAEPAHMYAFLAAASTQMIAREGRLLLPDATEEDSRRAPTFFKTKAIRALRAKLATGQLDHHLAVDAHRLYSTGIDTDNYEVAEPHFQALLSMVEALGGLGTFDEYHLEKMILLDCTAALKCLGVPRLLAIWDPGPLTEAMLVNIGSQGQYHLSAGTRLREMLEMNPCQALAESFSDLVQVLKMSVYLTNLPEYIPEHYKWFNWRVLIILHRLLSMPLHCEMNDTTDCLRIATAYWTAMTRAPAMARRAAAKSNHTLRRKLERTDLRYLWRPHTDCLLWVVVFGGICSDDKDDVEWYVGVAKVTATEIGVRNLQALEDLFSTFLYDPNSQREMLIQFAARMWPVNDMIR